MAFATEPVATVVIGLVDASGSRSKVTGHLPSATLAATAITRAEALAALVVALTDAEVETVSITYGATDAASADAIFPGASIEEQGRFVLQTAAGKRVKINIPAIKDAVVDQAGAIPLTDADVTAFLNELTTGGWCDSNGSDLVATNQAYKGYRNSTRKMLPSSRTVGV